MDVIKANEWVVVTDQASSYCQLGYVDASKSTFPFARKHDVPTEFLIGLPYGSAVTRDGSGNWVRCSRVSIDDFIDRVRARLCELGIKHGASDMADMDDDDEKAEATAEGIDYAKCRTGSRGKQKLTAECIVLKKSEKQPLLDLIVDVCAGASSFQERSEYSQEKYIRKKLSRHLLLLTFQKVTLSTLYQAYVGLGSGIRNDNGNTVGGRHSGWVPLEILGTILNEANITAGSKCVVADQTMGMLVSAAMSRLINKDNVLGSQLIYAAELKGSSSQLMQRMNFDSNALKLIYREIPFHILRTATSRENTFDDETLREEFPLFFHGARMQPTADMSEFHQKRFEAAVERRDQRLALRISSWQNLAAREIDAVIASTNSSCFLDNDVRLTANCLGDIYKVALASLRPNGRLVIYHNDMQPLSDLFAFIKARRHTWCDCTFVEVCHRRICTLAGRSHPQMDTAIRLSQGFVLTATRMLETEHEPTGIDDYGMCCQTAPKPGKNPLVISEQQEALS